MTPQSGLEYSMGPTVHKEQNVVFSDQMSAYKTEVTTTVDPTRMQQDTHDAELADFFARPVKIVEYDWSIGSTLFEQFNPWDLYLGNARVVNRIANFNLLRCKLHLKFVINANGFMYSRVLTSYLPYPSQDYLTESSALFPNDAVQESQMPHIFINPTTSTGGEMVLPFFWHDNNFVTPFTNWSNAGRITMRSLAPLKHANGATGVATISVFAWAEDMSLNVLTSVDPDTMVPQMGVENEVDEANSKGMISGPATAVANAAAALSVVPEIAPFALATNRAASTVAGVAKAFGYSRPAQTRDNCPIKPVITSSLSMTTVPDTTQKLTVDDKQELSIDPRIAGLGGEDPLSLKKIASTESYLTSFDWVMGTSPETLLWNGRVDPCTFARDGTKLHLPACCVAALPFYYWTGTMKFRFQIMCSAYHKGRLKVSWDPNFVSNEEFNTMYSRVVDLSSETDFTVSITNGQYRSLLEHHLPGVDSVTQLYSTTRYTSNEEGNGVIAISVLNELTTPNSTVNNDITINVFVSTGDDFEVFVPTEKFAHYVFKPQMGREPMAPQSGKEVIPDSFASEQDEPEQGPGESIGPTIDNLDKLCTVFAGESVKSFRQLLKRYSLHSALGVLTGGDQVIYLNTAYFPYLRGNVDGAKDLTSLSAPYNYCNTLLLHWVVNCFSGWRGSIRTKVIPQGHYRTSDKLMTMHVERDMIDSSAYNQYRITRVSAPAYLNNNEAAEDAVAGVAGLQKTFGARGQMFTLDRVNPVAEFEVPFYSNKRFIPGKIENYTGPRKNSYAEMPGVDYYIWVNGNNTTTLNFYHAIGEDFTTYFWTGCPPVYYEANPPVA